MRVCGGAEWAVALVRLSERHTAEPGVDEDQIDVVTLTPGENVTGTVTGKGVFDAQYVTYTDGLIGDSVRGDVS